MNIDEMPIYSYFKKYPFARLDFFDESDFVYYLDSIHMYKIKHIKNCTLMECVEKIEIRHPQLEDVLNNIKFLQGYFSWTFLTWTDLDFEGFKNEQ